MILKKLLKNVDIINMDGEEDSHVDLDTDIEDIFYDSRRVIPNSIFFCIKGLTVDGHDYAKEAVKKGASVLVLERDVEVEGDVLKIFVWDSLEAMSRVSQNFYDNPSRKVKLIGVTGTNGKTTITHLVKSILEEAGQRVGLIGTITNMIGDRKIPSEFTTPQSPELQKLLKYMVDQGAETIVMEVSSHSLALGRVKGMNFDIGVFSNLSQDHLDLHGTMDEYKSVKAKLFNQCDLAIINIDDETGRWISDQLEDKLTYAISMPANIYARDLEITEKGVVFEVHTPKGKAHINLGIPGIFSIYNSLAATAICHTLNIPLEFISKGLNDLKGVNGRFEVLETDTDYSVIIDYAHTPESLKNVLETAKGFVRGRLISLFGCGGDRDQGKRPIMGEVSAQYADLSIITSDNPRGEDPRAIIEDILVGFNRVGGDHVIIENRREAIEYALNHGRKDDVIILAGKGHETYQILKDEIIDFDEKKIVKEFLERKKVDA